MKTILLFSVLLFPVAAIAQKEIQIPVNHQIILNFIDRTVYAEIMTNDHTIDPQLGLIYHWYKANDIKTTRGGYDGKLLHGTYTEFYPEMSLKQKGEFRYGVKHGLWKTWHLNGELESVTNWRKGKMHGKFRLFDEKGFLVKEGSYREDLLHGEITTFLADKENETIVYKDGVRVEQKGFWKQVFNRVIKRKKKEKEKVKDKKTKDEDVKKEKVKDQKEKPEKIKEPKKKGKDKAETAPGEKQEKKPETKKKKQKTPDAKE